MALLERKRWIVVREDTGEVFCGLAKHFQFKPISDIGDTAIKTYRSEAQALAGFANSWHGANFSVRAVPVMETLTEDGGVVYRLYKYVDGEWCWWCDYEDPVKLALAANELGRLGLEIKVEVKGAWCNG